MLLIPFINGHVTLINTGSENKSLLNLKNVSKITFYRTKKALEATNDKSLSQLMEDMEFSQFE